MPTRFDHFVIAAQPAERLSFEQNMAGYFDEEGDLKLDTDGSYARDKAKAAFAGWSLGTTTDKGLPPKGAALMPAIPSEGVILAMVDAGLSAKHAPSVYRRVQRECSSALERERFETAARDAGISERELSRWPDGLYQFNATQHAYVAWQICRVDHSVWLRQEPTISALCELSADVEPAQRAYGALFEALNAGV